MDARSLHQLGAERWPEIELELDGFVELAASCSESITAERAGDLYIAYACARGEPRALEVFDREFLPSAIGAVRRMRASETAASELAQVLREHLLVAEPGALPRIATYSGTGSLKRWLGAIAVRRYLNSLRDGKRESLIGDQALLDAIGASSADPELALLKETYREQFRAGLTEALTGLEDRQKNLLRLRFVDGLTVTDLAALHRVHRATMHRWLADAHAEVAERAETLLCERLSVDASELASIRRLVRSQLQVSLERLLVD